MALLFLFLGMLCQVQAQTLSSLTVTPANPTGGTNATGQVTLTAPAPANGLTVSLASSQPGIASVQASVTVASGQTQASFNVTTTSVAAATAVTLSATDGTTPQSAAMTVLPPQVTGFWVRPSTLIGGGSVTGTISLDAAAPTGGLRFSISSSKSQAAFAPATLYVPAGANSFTFSIQTSTVNYPITVTLTEPSSGLTAILSLLPTNLHVVGLLPPHVVQLAWDAQQTTQYRLYRAVYPPNSDADWTLVATLPGSALSCNDAFNFVPGTAYVYVLKTDQALYYSADIVQPYFVAANGNQAVDSRLDLRYATTVFQDHNFGGSAYRGGLFAGFANDPARIGRSFARFPIDSQPAPTLPSFRVGNIAAYLTTAYTTGNSAVQMQVTCQALLSGFWDPMATTWSTAPAVDPNAPKSFAMVQYDPTAPVSQWLTWSLGDTIKQAALNHTPLSVAWASASEGANGWAYFAKKEYDTTKAPAACYAWCGPTVLSVTLSPSNIVNNASVVATVNVNGLGPGDSVPIYIWHDTSGLFSVGCPASMTVSSTNNTFTVSGLVLDGSAQQCLIYVSLFPRGTYAPSSYFRWYASALLTINGSGGKGGVTPAGPPGPGG